MPSYYCVIQYVPDPIKDERINIGIVAFAGDQIRTRFVKDWWRVQRFGDRSVSFLKDFARQFQEAEESGGVFSETTIRGMAGRWMNSIQFSEPRGSVLNLEELLEDASVRFLHEKQVRPRPRDRRAVARLAANAIGDALESIGGVGARRLLKRNRDVQGRLEPHKFDVALENGLVLAAADAFSFEGTDLENVATDVRARAFAFKDVKTKFPELDLAVVFIAPDVKSSEVVSATRIFEDLGADVVPEDVIPDWAESVAENAIGMSKQGARLGRV